MKEKVILDVDPGIDDSIAMIYGFLSDKLDVRLVSVVAGNVDINQCTLNALYITENFAGREVPVVQGASTALKKPANNKLNVHGKKGLGDKIEVSSTQLKPINKKGYGASEAIRDVVLQNKHEITIVCAGPSTNVALAFEKYPEIIEYVKSVVIMGGSVDGTGSITPYAGFNVFSDPEACDEVVKSGVNVTFSPKEIGLSTYLVQATLDKWSKLGRVGSSVRDIYSGYRDLLIKSGRFATHDLCALMSVAYPEFFEMHEVDVSVDLSDGEKRGQTIFEQKDQSKIKLIFKANRKKVLAQFERTLRRAK